MHWSTLHKIGSNLPSEVKFRQTSGFLNLILIAFREIGKVVKKIAKYCLKNHRVRISQMVLERVKVIVMRQIAGRYLC